MAFQGIITSLGAEEGLVNSEEHGELPFDICENFSDAEFNTNDIHKEVEFTVALVSPITPAGQKENKTVLIVMHRFVSVQVKSNKRAIRLRRTKMIEDKILHEQKRREEEEKKKKREEEERKKQEEEERKRREEEQQKEVEKKKKEEVAAVLAAAKHKVRNRRYRDMKDEQIIHHFKSFSNTFNPLQTLTIHLPIIVLINRSF